MGFIVDVTRQYVADGLWISSEPADAGKAGETKISARALAVSANDARIFSSQCQDKPQIDIFLIRLNTSAVLPDLGDSPNTPMTRTSRRHNV
jgi:hypothetical protein